jgi:hypothetical protein
MKKIIFLFLGLFIIAGCSSLEPLTKSETREEEVARVWEDLGSQQQQWFEEACADIAYTGGDYLKVETGQSESDLSHLLFSCKAFGLIETLTAAYHKTLDGFEPHDYSKLEENLAHILANNHFWYSEMKNNEQFVTLHAYNEYIENDLTGLVLGYYPGSCVDVYEEPSFQYVFSIKFEGIPELESRAVSWVMPQEFPLDAEQACLDVLAGIPSRLDLDIALKCQDHSLECKEEIKAQPLKRIYRIEGLKH